MTNKLSHNIGKRRRSGDAPPIRILTAVPICDGHDSAVMTINLELARHEIEVIYLGYHRSARDVARAAVQEDVQAIGLSSYNGGHIEFFADVRALLRREGAMHIGLFGGGGGTITTADAKVMKRQGVDEIFFAGTPLAGIVQFVRRAYAAPPRWVQSPARLNGPGLDRALTQLLSAAASAPGKSKIKNRKSKLQVVGITGPGGSGKTTLIDELALRFLNNRPEGRLAILSHDPGFGRRGALLGDRASLINAQHDRVFMRSLAAQDNHAGMSAAAPRYVDVLRRAGFDLVLVETAGIGQQDSPFVRGLVDRQVLVLSPDYGGRLQLQKIRMLEAANLVVVNKGDRPGAATACAEVQQHLDQLGHNARLLTTVAKRHRDPGVDQLFCEISA